MAVSRLWCNDAAQERGPKIEMWSWARQSTKQPGHIDRAKPLHNGRKIWTAQIKAAPGPGLFSDRGLAFDFRYRPLK
jgi:hypothetical protein